MKSLGSKTILITGAAGTIGSTLAESFVETGCVVFCTDIFSKNYSNKFFFDLYVIRITHYSLSGLFILIGFFIFSLKNSFFINLLLLF